MKKNAMEQSDFNQPQGLLVGWPEAPRPRKMVFPVYYQYRKLYIVSKGVVLSEPTGLHRQETGPRIVGAAVTESGSETKQKTDEIGIFDVHGLCPPC